MLTKSTEYAIRALVFIQLKNSEDIRPGVAEIAQEIEAPVAYSAKILQTLTKKGLLVFNVSNVRSPGSIKLRDTLLISKQFSLTQNPAFFSAGFAA